MGSLAGAALLLNDNAGQKGRPGKAAGNGLLVGETLRRHQIAGKSLELQLPSIGRKVGVARVMTSGMVTTLEIGRSAAKF
jgi:hypothetical protein